MLQAALQSEGLSGPAALVSSSAVCKAVVEQLEVRHIVDMLAAVQLQPDLPSKFTSAFQHLSMSCGNSTSWANWVEVHSPLACCSVMHATIYILSHNAVAQWHTLGSLKSSFVTLTHMGRQSSQLT